MKMGESAYLPRFFSHPSGASPEIREGDHIRALTESVSFGRFMSESLAWEKWSAFSHNRYLEEVEKLAKIGFVAQKKAYFEDHYRRRAAGRENSFVTKPTSAREIEFPTTEVNPTSVGDVEDVTAKLGQTESEHRMEFREREEEGYSHSCGADSVCSPDVSLDEIKSENIETKNSESLQLDTAIENIAKEENLLPRLDLDECIGIGSSESKTKEATDIQTSTSGKKHTMSSSMSVDGSKASKLLFPRANVSTTNEGKLRKDRASSREKLLVEKKKPVSKSLHMSISFSPPNVSTSKTISPVLQQIRKLKDITASTRLQQEISLAQKLPDRASVYTKTTDPQIIMKSEDRRVKGSLNKSVDGRLMMGKSSEDRRMKGLLNKSVEGRLMMGKSSSSLPKENSNCSSANGGKSQSPIVCMPFRFRSEERAAKRKEKQEEKLKAMEAEKMKAHEGYRSPTIQPRSPKLGKKASQGMGSETKPRSLQQTSYRVDNTANREIGKSYPHARPPVLSSLSRSHVCENSSPNILGLCSKLIPMQQTSYRGMGSETKPRPLQQASYRADKANRGIGKSRPSARAALSVSLREPCP
ncbi:hypothetical protein SAY87_015738 [Trapa incisa]|uniref:TPX2 C-terminal domain-containing protein n=1 Tax=Trapa incisa TaxID=236973 RepID=A0AAN7LFP3_9MYRT|nr:hypothetical protein SAY87_015738 [Trapa incisa]